MKSPLRIPGLAAALAGGGLLIWKGFPGLVFFPYGLVISSMLIGRDIDPVMPDFLVAAAGFVLIAVSQVISIWLADPGPGVHRFFRTGLVLIAGVVLVPAFVGAIQAFAVIAELGLDPSYLEKRLLAVAPLFYAGVIALSISAFFGVAVSAGESRLEVGRTLRWVETFGWIFAVLLLCLPGFSYGRLDVMTQSARMGSQLDPAEMARDLSNILKGGTWWGLNFLQLGAVGIVSAFYYRRAAEFMKENQGGE